jgi:hypothetical protein
LAWPGVGRPTRARPEQLAHALAHGGAHMAMTLAWLTVGEWRLDGEKVFTERLKAVWRTHLAIGEAPAHAE